MMRPTRAAIGPPSRRHRHVTTLTAALASAIALGPDLVSAQTAAQMEYDRQQREYRQALERQREEQQRLQQLQQENARRQQGSQSPAPLGQGPAAAPPAWSGSTYAGRSAAPAAAGDPLQLCKANPLRPGERNPLLGRWQPKDMPASGDPFAQLLHSMAAPQCMAFAMGLELRQAELLSVAGPAPARYGRNGDEWYVCLPQSAVQVLVFRLRASELVQAGTNCRLVRAR